MWLCIATITFSVAVIRLNSRMFWNVRASPRCAMRVRRLAGDVAAAEVHPAVTSAGTAR